MMTACTAWTEVLRARNAIWASASYGATITSTPAALRACGTGHGWDLVDGMVDGMYTGIGCLWGCEPDTMFRPSRSLSVSHPYDHLAWLAEALTDWHSAVDRCLLSDRPSGALPQRSSRGLQLTHLSFQETFKAELSHLNQPLGCVRRDVDGTLVALVGGGRVAGARMRLCPLQLLSPRPTEQMGIGLHVPDCSNRRLVDGAGCRVYVLSYSSLKQLGPEDTCDACPPPRP